MIINNLQNENRKYIASMQNFYVLEHERDASVAPANAITEFYMSKMGVRRRQLVITLDGKHSAIVQAGEMQWTLGNITITSGVKGVGDLFGKAIKGAVTKETAVKPEYVGSGFIVLEPTYKFILLEDVSTWGPGGMTIEDGMFLASDGNVVSKVTHRKTVSSAILGGEGLFNLSLSGSGVVALESNVPVSELVTVELQGEELKIDGNLAVCWSTSLDFTVEKSAKTLIGSALTGEGLVNVYRGTGKVLMSPVAPTNSLYSSTNTMGASPAAPGSNVGK